MMTSPPSPNKRMPVPSADHADVLACHICLEVYDDHEHEAKFLNCHHSFCSACLSHLAAKTREYIECPSCRAHTILTDAGIPALQTNFYITHMRETFNKIGSPKMKGCIKHAHQPMSFFCQKCGIPICRDCTVLDHKEIDGHTIQDIAVAEQEQRCALTQQMEQARCYLATVQGHMQHMEAEICNLATTKETALKELDATFEKCTKMLEFRKLQLAKNVFDIYNKKQEALIKRGDEQGMQMRNLMTMLGQSDNVMRIGPLSEVVTASRNITSATIDVQGSLGALSLGENYLKFDGQAGLPAFEGSVCNIGKVITSGFLPTKVVFKTQESVACKRSSFTMVVYAHTGEKLSNYDMSVLVIDSAGTHLKTSISQLPEGQYFVTFIPEMRGEHRLVACFQMQPIKGAETIILVQSNNPDFKFGGQGTGEGNFLSPRAVVIDKDGSLFIADTGNRLIQKTNADGKFLRQFSINKNRENCSTCDLALNQNKGVVVCTETVIGSGINPTMGNNVLVYSTDGEIRDVFCNKIMKCALCIATNSKGDIIVSDYLVHSLFMYDEDGNFVRRIGHSGTFNHPAFICVDKSDNIIVSDTNNDCIQIFDPEGNYLLQFGSSGNGKGELKQPFGVATDGKHILVVDSGNRRIQIFNTDGTFAGLIESVEDPFDQPRGMAVAKNGRVYVADRDNHCVKVFTYDLSL